MDNSPNCPGTAAPESLAAFTSRELDLLRHYADPASPGYLNATRSAELAGYKGLPGSNQLSVQGCRTVSKARKLGVLVPIMLEKGCLLERAIERLSVCLDAKRKRIFMTKAGMVEGPLEEDHRVQLEAVKVTIRLHGAFDAANHQELSLAATCHDTGAADQEQVSEEYRSAMAIVNKSDVVDRESLRDVLECDTTSVDLETREPQSGIAERSGQGPVLQDHPKKA